MRRTRQPSSRWHDTSVGIRPIFDSPVAIASCTPFFVFSLGASLQPLAAFLLTKLRKPWFWDALFAAGVTIFLAICADPDRGGLTVWAAALVMFGLYADQGVRRLLAGNRVMVFLGEISYALHWGNLATADSSRPG